MPLNDLLLLAAGLVILVVGADALVRGASRLALAFGISPLVIGLTVVAFGTSAPELAVSLQSTFTGKPDVVIGNVVGSNIFNILLILGLCALLKPLLVASQVIRLDVPLMIFASLGFWWVARDLNVSRGEGLLLFAGMVAYTVFQIVQSRRESAAVQMEFADEFTPKKPGGLLAQLAWIGFGLALLVFGAHLLVESATAMARSFGVGELEISLTIVAAGTSLPEVATSIVATLKGERDIAVGNVIGSNLFNILGVLGLSAIFAPDGVAVHQNAIDFDIPVLCAVAIVCLPVFLTGTTISRIEGLALFGFYVAYTVYLILNASKHPATSNFSEVFSSVVFPLTGLWLLASFAHWLRTRNSSEW